MRVQIIQPGHEHGGVSLAPPVVSDVVPASYGRWRPEVVVGAPSPGALVLPPATPTASWLYGPRGVCLGDDLVVVADTGNHRVLIYRRIPTENGEPADVVLGQPDATSEGPQAAGAGPEQGMSMPTGVLHLPDGRLVVADAWNHRILIWNSLPERQKRADLVLGQPSLSAVEPNRGGDATGNSFYWPFGISLIDGRFYVADTGNRRVLVWVDGVPDSPDQPADVVLGQPDPFSRGENRDGPPAADSFRWPHTITGNGGGIVVADAGNHRLLGWVQHPETDGPADYVLGQPDMATAVEFPYRRHTGTDFRFPYAGLQTPSGLAVADTANNRILLWDGDPYHCTIEPDVVLGQPSFSATGENRWEQVGMDTLCWPYGLAAHGDRIAIADSGNNRVVLWRRT